MKNITKKSVGNGVKLLIFSALLFLTLLAYYYINKQIESGSFLNSKDGNFDLSASKLVELDENRIALTIPGIFATDATQNKLDKTAKELGYEAMTLDEEGNITYTITKEQHKEMMSNLRNGLEETFKDMVGKGSFKKITNIEANEDLTYIKVTLSSKDTDTNTSLSLVQFKTYSSMYYAFNGTPDLKLTVEYFDPSGNLLASFHGDEE